ncbi:hypothetical protein BGZ63DRAFT_421464 [Mariannaea sp. PMI_226]|nr:hypothetical protein BGZ63DRAFT_421464 [Mariannaea sp. PMI_226]
MVNSKCSPSAQSITFIFQKRKLSQSGLVSTDPDQYSSKKPKLNHQASPLPWFWDNLSFIFLTTNALRELDRRNRLNQHALEKAEQTQGATDQISLQSSPRDLQKLKRFARCGGPDLKDLRGYHMTEAEGTMGFSRSSLGRRKRGSHSTSRTRATPTTTTTKSTTPYDRNFQQHLIDHDIFPEGYEYPDGQLPPEPDNLDEIIRELQQHRASLSPSRFSKSDFRKFRRADVQASKEIQVITDVLPIIEGDSKDSKFIGRQIPFTNLDHLTDGTIVSGNPDLYYGARPEQLDQAIRQELSGHVIPSTQQDLPIAPNFFVEVKGPNGSFNVASRQACYNGALGARNIHTLQSYGLSEPEYDNKAYALTSYYHGGHLRMFTSHPMKPSSPEAPPGFAMTPLRSWSLVSDAESFRQGVAAYRNGRDWAKKQRDQSIRQANKTARRNSTQSLENITMGLSSTSKAYRNASEEVGTKATTTLTTNKVSSFYNCDTSADELSLDFEPPTKRLRRYRGR